MGSDGPAVEFRALARDDLPLLRRWLNTPHVYEWWGREKEPSSIGGPGGLAATEEEVEEHYGRAADGLDTMRVHVTRIDGHDAGLIQWFRMTDEEAYARDLRVEPAGAAGIDLFIGEPGLVDRGNGPRVIDAYVCTVVFAEPDLDRVYGCPLVENGRSIGAFRRAGFRHLHDAEVTGESGAAHVMMRTRP